MISGKGEMNDARVTRKRFIVTGTAAAVGGTLAATGIESARGANADHDFLVGRFVRAQGPHIGVVETDDSGSVLVIPDAEAFVAHGTDGVVDSFDFFVPGELVAVRGGRAGRRVAATEVQSVYISVAGAFATDGSEHWLMIPSGGRVRVPDSVLQRDAPNGISRGEVLSVTAWMNPKTGETTALEIRE